MAKHSLLGQTAYGTATSYSKIPAGSYALSVNADKGRQTLSTFPPFQLDAEQDHRYTGIAIGNATSWPHAKMVLFDDMPVAPPDDEYAMVRVIDTFPHSTKLDLIVNNIVAFHDLGFGEESKPIALSSGPCNVKTLAAGTYTDPMAGPIPFRLDPGKSYLIVILGPDTPAQPGIIAVSDN
jgi:hypothetical protein